MIAGYIAGILGIFFGELGIKNTIEKQEDDAFPRSILKGKVILRRHHNKGAVLNFAEGKRAVVAAVSLILTLAALVWFIISLGQGGSRLLQVGLSMLLGGAFSNTYDRLHRKYVVDYFSLNVGSRRLKRIIFNLADFCIMIGALLTALGAAQ